MSRMRPQSSAVFISLVAFSAGTTTVTECTSTECTWHESRNIFTVMLHAVYGTFHSLRLVSFVGPTTERQISAIPAKCTACGKGCVLHNWLLWTRLAEILIYSPLILIFVPSSIIDLMRTKHYLSPLIYLINREYIRISLIRKI